MARSSARDGLDPRGRGGDIVHPHIEEYIDRLDTPRDAVLLAMERQAAEQDFPHVGPLVGRLICLLTRTIGARRILELGSGFGYSGYWFAQGMPDDGELILTESSAKQSAQAEAYFRQGGVRCRVQFLVGNGFEILDRLPGQFDIIFNDVDKTDYPLAFHKAVPRVKPGGLFISDNMLWGGRVATDTTHPTTQGVAELTRLLFAAPNLYTSLIPVRDGVTVSLKLQD